MTRAGTASGSCVCPDVCGTVLSRGRDREGGWEGRNQTGGHVSDGERRNLVSGGVVLGRGNNSPLLLRGTLGQAEEVLHQAGPPVQRPLGQLPCHGLLNGVLDDFVHILMHHTAWQVPSSLGHQTVKSKMRMLNLTLHACMLAQQVSHQAGAALQSSTRVCLLCDCAVV